MEMERPEVHEHDSFGKLIGVQTAILAVLLSIFTIFSHREHTDTLLFSNQTSNSWAHYQAKRIRANQLEMNMDLIRLLAAGNPQSAEQISTYRNQSEKYAKELDGLKEEAQKYNESAEAAHHKAGFYDLAEGMLEIAVILSSLYFISRKRFFPILGLLIGLGGILVGMQGLLVH